MSRCWLILLFLQFLRSKCRSKDNLKFYRNRNKYLQRRLCVLLKRTAGTLKIIALQSPITRWCSGKRSLQKQQRNDFNIFIHKGLILKLLNHFAAKQLTQQQPRVGRRFLRRLRQQHPHLPGPVLSSLIRLN